MAFPSVEPLATLAEDAQLRALAEQAHVEVGMPGALTLDAAKLARMDGAAIVLRLPDEQPIGFAAVLVSPHPFAGGCVAHVQAFYVDENARLPTRAVALFEAVLEHAKLRKARWITACAPPDTPASVLFGRLMQRGESVYRLELPTCL